MAVKIPELEQDMRGKVIDEVKFERLGFVIYFKDGSAFHVKAKSEALDYTQMNYVDLNIQYSKAIEKNL